ncbi:spore coat U domain-containing protein [Novosphingobium resinovorum]|uniref:Csu type fimbrial protein n=1 Tax=Novosphingobium resinovorum TaxID=158500 RepID=UPI002ED2EA80|nr:spore coat U domain-containing protein [Novosphingobium resinovorum]
MKRHVRPLGMMMGLAAGLVPTVAADAAGCTVCICSLSTTNLSFGTYNPASSSPTTAQGSAKADCISISIPMNATVDFGLSAGTSGNAAARQMASGSARLNYNIYQDAGYTTVWGNGSNGGTVQTMAITNLLSFSGTKTAYGRIPAGQYVKTGAYTDSIVVTFTF